VLLEAALLLDLSRDFGMASNDGSGLNSGEVLQLGVDDRERFRDWEGLQKIKNGSAALLELL
jgi:hypothetical protein